ncbi:pantoate--beta-alanine ligase [Rubrobacter aplysinae]|uniref:pantoate--beta-alanine ligase n=1 Tax=Rubrobacter aplysinae TaxID=909625 RepID=UPI00064C17B5|nr:pantoate--beta-alanine ligase [Rubrobacter aplysinae]
MEVLRNAGDMRSFAGKSGGAVGESSVGLVPTMGYLHEGHLSLVRRARRECGAVVVSIFVNPLQFGPAEDLDRYPRDEERDLRLAEEAGVDAVFLPRPEEMYPVGFTTEVRVRGLEDVLEGASRPGHFAGVATVLVKLLNVVGPDRMYMGQKDAQQAVVVRRMMRDLGFAASLVVCPTVRERDGLALSSRNVYLSAAGREAALAIPRALRAAEEAGQAGDGEPPARLAHRLRELVKGDLTLQEGLEVDYVSAADAESLGDAADGTRAILLSCAAKAGDTRLIDNVVVRLEPEKAVQSPLL